MPVTLRPEPQPVDPIRAWWPIVVDILGLLFILTTLLYLGIPPLLAITHRIFAANSSAGNSAGETTAPGPAQPPLPPAGVGFGQALAWRELYRFEGGWQFRGSALLGQFDTDPEAELLLQPSGHNCILLDADGIVIQLGLQLPGSVYFVFPWDYTGDGIDELIPDVNLSEYLHSGQAPPAVPPGAPNPALYTPVLDLQGQVIAQLYGQSGMMLWHRLKHASPELVLFDDLGRAGRKLIAYQPGGAKTGTLLLGPNWYGEAVVDFDMDGADELLLNDYYSGVRSDWKLLKSNFSLSEVLALKGEEVWGTADVNGDGRMDCFTWYDTWFDFATRKKTRLQLPPPAPAITLEDGLVGSRAVGSYLGPGSRQVAFYYGPGIHPTALVIFDAAGSCLHFEELGEDCFALLTWRFDHQDHLVLCTASRVLIYP